MRVLIDSSALLMRSAGVKNYVYYWLEHLRKLAGNDEIAAFPLMDEIGPLTHERSTRAFLETVPRLLTLHAVNVKHLHLIDWFTRGADIFHMSNQVRQLPRGPKVTATIHDLTSYLMPELHTSANVHVDREFNATVLPKADRLIAVSENTRQDAIRQLGIPEDRIEVIYSGVPDVFFGAKGRATKRPYALFVGTIEPRKNIDRLLDAWRQAGLHGDFDLKVAGPQGWNSAATLARLRAGEPGVEYLDYVPEDELPGLTAGATAFVYPSLYEGFGFPVAQAMAARVPIVTSNNSCLPEIAGGAALLVDPRSVDELARGLKRLLTSPALQEQLATAGYERAQRYRWDECARTSLAFFRKAGSKA